MQNIQATSSSLDALTEQYRTMSVNLANASTAGYKRRCNAFSQTLASQMSQPSQQGPSDVPASEIQNIDSVDFTQGNLSYSGQSLDMALQGKGFFVIETPNGQLYTRSGVFRPNAQGQLADFAGRIVSGEGGPITIPTTADISALTVTSDGEVLSAGESIGKLKVVEFTDPAVLVPTGQNCFKAPLNVAPASATDTTVRQGYQESSNVNIVEELVGLITVSRMYEANLKNVQAQDDKNKSLLGVAMK